MRKSRLRKVAISVWPGLGGQPDRRAILMLR